ncbi:MAG: 50S ribosomal protein L29 [Chloroflexi bacterium]|nr:50S ribosomal protein L29 [Chloroflexota bacterium]MCH8008447.1 50S ribosomal protein L29 [Chloroflexota bacterium]
MPAKQQVAELRELSDEDLAKELEETYRELFTTRLQLTTRQLANTAQPRKVRTKLAQIKTIQRERELAALHEAAVQPEEEEEE